MTVERWRMLSGRVAQLDTSQPTAAVTDAREMLRAGGAVLINEEAPGAGGNQPEGQNQNTNTHEGEPIMTSIAEPTQCAYGWCEEDHDDCTGNPDIHSRSFTRGGIRFDFVLDERPDAPARTYINWMDMFEEEFTPEQLGRINEIAAALIVGKAAFEQFVQQVAAPRTVRRAPDATDRIRAQEDV
ncbi:hypothetical protein DY023_06530 [Microbacterium bovistercoris]|uniref:Uncharacterized protein n=1 Tax=Microbacterium bovistercoris TaxID=2293570 RepID=A0A371NVZ2_9MICO|nr:hypothetical protein [Microbacterium bovistercoris]REJ06281.1 hypothetical protein DY023_06530 [Microbacterium bovistercoris]